MDSFWDDFQDKVEALRREAQEEKELGCNAFIITFGEFDKLCERALEAGRLRERKEKAVAILRSNPYLRGVCEAISILSEETK